MLLQPGQVVRSLAGHDKGRYYAIVGFSEGLPLIADGKVRKCQGPKRKNPRHLAPTKGVVPGEALASNRALRKALAAYNDTAATQTMGGNKACQKMM